MLITHTTDMMCHYGEIKDVISYVNKNNIS